MKCPKHEFRTINDVFNKAFLAFKSGGAFLSFPSRLETTTKRILITIQITEQNNKTKKL